MSEQQTTTTTPALDVGELVGPLLMMAVFKGQDITPVIDALLNSKITETLITKLAASVPEEYQDIVDVIKLAAQMDTINGLLAAIRGGSYQPKFGVDRAVEVILMLNLVSKLSQAAGA